MDTITNNNTALHPSHLYHHRNREYTHQQPELMWERQYQQQQQQHQHQHQQQHQQQYYRTKESSSPRAVNHVTYHHDYYPSPNMHHHHRNIMPTFPAHPSSFSSSHSSAVADESLLFASETEYSNIPTNNKQSTGTSRAKKRTHLSLIKEESMNGVHTDTACQHKEAHELEQEDDNEEDEYANDGSEYIHKSNVVIERKRYRRESHNAVERRRRNNINDNIKNLGLLLPSNICQGKMNKGTILKGSVMYIHMLNDQLARCKARLDSLKYEAAILDPSLFSPISNKD